MVAIFSLLKQRGIYSVFEENKYLYKKNFFFQLVYNFYKEIEWIMIHYK